MPRPRKCRRVCGLPKYSEFRPAGAAGEDAEPVVLTVDEYEAIRLIDYEGLSQAECCEYMKISRTTVQEIYSEARKKLASALVNGRPFQIRGGDYRLCDGTDTLCGCGGCRRYRGGR